MEPFGALRAFQNLFSQLSSRAGQSDGRVSRRRKGVRALPAGLEQLEERVVPAAVTGFGGLDYTAFPGEANTLRMSPGFLTFISDSPDVTIIQTPPGFSSNWLSAVSVSIGV